MATIGPSTSTHERVRELVDAGMDVARLNFSHGTHAEHAERAGLVRAVQEELGRPLALIADLQGPKLRIGDLPHPIVLARGSKIVVTGEGAGEGELPVSPAVLGEVLEPGNDMLIDDGLVRLRVDEVEHGRAHCTVLVGGPRLLAQGREPAGRPGADPLADPKDSPISSLRSGSAWTSSRCRSSAPRRTCASSAR